MTEEDEKHSPGGSRVRNVNTKRRDIESKQIAKSGELFYIRLIFG